MDDQALKQKWIAALRSGEYPQTRRTLHNGDGYCCLGVLCEVAGLERQKISAGRYGYVDTDGLEIRYAELPPTFAKQNALRSQGTLLSSKQISRSLGEERAHALSSRGGGEESIVWLNDSGATFGEIAQLIEDYL